MGISFSNFSGNTSGNFSNGFSLIVDNISNPTYSFEDPQPAGSYVIESQLGDSSFDIYAINSLRETVGYASGPSLVATTEFDTIVLYGAQNGDILSFAYKPGFSPTTSGNLDQGAAPFVTSAATPTLPNIDDTTIITGGNFATNVIVKFVGQDNVERSAKNVVRSSSTELIVTRPDSLPTDQEPYSIVITNPGTNNPVSTSVNILSNYIDAGSGITWASSVNQYYIPLSESGISLNATDGDGSSVNFSIVSGTLPEGYSLNASTGAIAGTHSGAEIEGDSSQVVVRATDAGGNFTDRGINFIAHSLPMWTTTALGNASIGQLFSEQLAVNYGSAASQVTYSLQSGTLPAGASLSSSGLIFAENISGTGGEQFIFTIRATDNLGFFADQEFTVTAVAAITLSYVVVAGGGGGGGGSGAGGGGAGGMLTGTYELAAPTTVTVGAGGAGLQSDANILSPGNNSVLGSITAIGGGGAGYSGANATNGGYGGSGGGGGSLVTYNPSSFNGTGGSRVSGQGNVGSAGSGNERPGAGGGKGAAASGFTGGAGGSTNIYGTTIYLAGGGGAGGYAGGGSGGIGGGGNGTSGFGSGNPGAANTGGGCGGTAAGSSTGKPGGSGVVILSAPTSATLNIGPGLTYNTVTNGSNTVYTFTAGSDTISN